MRIGLFLATVVCVILVPFFLWEGNIQTLVEGVLTKPYNSAIVAASVVSLLLLDVVLPVPSSIVSIAAGTLLGFGIGLLSIWSGLTLGSVFGYILGRFAHGFVCARLLQAHDLARMRSAFEHCGGWVLVTSRPLPLVAELVTLTAGVIHMPFRAFLLYIVPANFVVAVVYSAAGAWAYAHDALTVWIVVALGIPWLMRALGILGGRKWPLR